MKTGLLHIAILLFCASCKQEIAVNIADRPEQLVVNAVLDPDSTLYFDLSLTQNITDDRPVPFPPDAVVEVMDEDSVIWEVLAHGGKGRYASVWFRPWAGKRYLFRITRGGKEYWVDEKVPDTLHAGIKDTGRILFQGRNNFFQVKLKIKDDALTADHYGFRLLRKYRKFSGNDTQLLSDWVNIETVDAILTEDPASRFSRKHLLFTDRFFNGTEQEFRFGAADLFGKTGEQTTSLELYVASYSKAAYDFYTSVNEHLLYQNDPFSQPTLLRGNVSGALGAAVGRYVQKYEITLK